MSDELPQSTREKIETLVASDRVVLFMKGVRRAPQCGFSASVVEMLDEWLEDYATVDVLADAELREGIKDFGQWPTLPQLYVGGKLIGGADIVSELVKSGELAGVLGVPGPLAQGVPEVNVSESAVDAFREYAGGAKPSVRLAIDRGFDAELDLEEPRPGDLVIDLGTMLLSMDRGTARRAEGITID